MYLMSIHIYICVYLPACKYCICIHSENTLNFDQTSRLSLLLFFCSFVIYQSLSAKFSLRSPTASVKWRPKMRWRWPVSFFLGGGGGLILWNRVFFPLLLLMEEILHQLIRSLSHYLQGFIHPKWCRISSINRSSWVFKSLAFDWDILLSMKAFWGMR